MTCLLRTAAVLMVGTAGSGMSASAASAAGYGGVQVTINGGAGRHLSHDDLLAPGAIDQPRVLATSRAPGRDETISVGGTTAAKLVQLAGVGLPALVDMSVTHASFSQEPIRITAPEVINGFFGDSLGGNPHFATFDAAGGDREVLFFRPLRSRSEATTDRVDPPVGTDLRVNLHTTGHPLTVQLTPDTRQIDPGERVSFSAGLDPTPPGPAPTYAWDFEGDGQALTNQDSSDSHLFATKGTYQARVTVTTQDGSSGTDSVLIQVGKAQSGGSSDAPSQPGASLGGGGPAGGGGSAKNGGGGASPDAPNSGPAKGDKTTHTRNRQSRAQGRSPARPPGSAGPAQGQGAARGPARSGADVQP
ncbi:MAG: PKD domain-containing protein, partial [Actinomycetota bacterium]|nr:PKD domain-containing protein [Actinomycetota bacterium]